MKITPGTETRLSKCRTVRVIKKIFSTDISFVDHVIFVFSHLQLVFFLHCYFLFSCDYILIVLLSLLLSLLLLSMFLLMFLSVYII